jgi:hypothetical protein
MTPSSVVKIAFVISLFAAKDLSDPSVQSINQFISIWPVCSFKKGKNRKFLQPRINP